MIFKAQTEWVKPTEFPDLRFCDEIAIDLETHDPELKTMGSGSVVGKGKVVGIAIATDGYAGYFPFDHEGGGNLEKSKVIQWFTDICASESTKIFHNAMYDISWIKSMGIKVNGRIVDTMIAASLVNENRFRYDLGSLGWDYCGRGKNETELVAAAKEWGLDPKADMWKMPAMYVGNYAERDAELTLALWRVMQKELSDQDLGSIFDLETQLFPCLVDMRFLGVRVNVEGAHKLKKQLAEQEKDNKTDGLDEFSISTKKPPSDLECEDLIFASKICKHTKSNTIVLAKNKQLISSGTGQTSRVDALRQAIEKSKKFKFSLENSVMASDAFFPFPDCVEIAHKEGICSVIQPGGSIKDNLSIDYCNKNNISMVITGTRHFKH